MTTNKKIILFVAVAVVAIVVIFVLSILTRKSPDYCDQFSGSQGSDGWATYTDAEKCAKAGCKVQKLEEYDGSGGFDLFAGYSFDCIPK